MTACRGRTRFCAETPTHVYRLRSGAMTDPIVLCAPCFRYLREMGMDVHDERPEWRRRAENGELTDRAPLGYRMAPHTT